MDFSKQRERCEGKICYSGFHWSSRKLWSVTTFKRVLKWLAYGHWILTPWQVRTPFRKLYGNARISSRNGCCWRFVHIRGYGRRSKSNARRFCVPLGSENQRSSKSTSRDNQGSPRMHDYQAQHVAIVPSIT